MRACRAALLNFIEKFTLHCAGLYFAFTRQRVYRAYVNLQVNTHNVTNEYD